jgi:hypothetical protein
VSGGGGATPELLATAPAFVFWSLAVGERHLFFAGHGNDGECGNGCARAVLKSGGPGDPMLLANDELEMSPLTLAGDRVIWTATMGVEGAHAHLRQALDGDPVAVDVQDIAPLGSGWTTAAAGHVYLAGPQELYRLESFGQPPTLLWPADGLILALHADPQGLYFLEDQTWKRLDPAAPDRGATAFAPTDQVTNVTVQDEDSVYWLDGVDVRRARKATGEVTVVATDLEVRFPALAVGGGQVYITTHDPDGPDVATSARVLQVSRDGGTPVVVARDYAISALAVDATHLYWGSSGGFSEQAPQGTVKRVPRR